MVMFAQSRPVIGNRAFLFLQFRSRHTAENRRSSLTPVKPPRLWILALVLGLLELGVNGCLAQEETGEDFFLTKIRPILSGTCFRCHGDLKVSGALRVDSRDALLQGGESGPAMVPGNSAESLLIRAMRRQENVSPMPPEDGDALTSDQIDAFVTWIGAGAPWPIDSAKFERASHWAYKPIQDVPPPDVVDKSWARDPLDLFIQSRWERAGLRPAPAADRPTLLRRATFDLTGLPPTPEDMAAFVNDESPDAFERVVDRLLASEAYGEHWGRHWLDVVRYADTAGETADYPVPLAWRYRNYVIHAFNSDKPYDEFLREQIAGECACKWIEPVRCKSLPKLSLNFVAESNRVVARQGGKQLEVND